MSHTLLVAVARGYRGPRHALDVLMVLAEHANAARIAWPSVATIAARLGRTERGVRKLLGALVDSGHIVAVGSRAGGRGAAVRWQIVEAALRVENPATDRRVSEENPERPFRVSGSETLNATVENPERHGRKTLNARSAEPNTEPTTEPTPKSTGTASPRLVDQPTEDATMTPHRNADRLPEWLPPAAWQEWRIHRGKKLTRPAIDRQIAKLDALRAEGHDPAQVIGLAIESGWATFYPPKRNPVARKSDRRTAFAHEIFGATPNGQHDEAPEPRVIDGEAERLG